MKCRTLVLKGSRTFIDGMLGPEFEQINEALSEYLAEVTDKVIREEVFDEAEEAGEAEEVAEPQRQR